MALLQSNMNATATVIATGRGDGGVSVSVTLPATTTEETTIGGTITPVMGLNKMAGTNTYQQAISPMGSITTTTGPLRVETKVEAV